MSVSLEFTEEELENIVYAVSDMRRRDQLNADEIRASLADPEYVADLPPGVEGELEGSAEEDERTVKMLTDVEVRIRAALYEKGYMLL